MRIKQKKQILEMLNTLIETHKQIILLCRQNDLSNATELLELCQNAALGIGNLLEEHENSELSAIYELENYCESIYNVATDLQKSNVQEKQIELLNLAVNSIYEQVQTYFHPHIEMVFFPYKASMWDSLESVWKEAEGDPDCDCYIVPLPYYDKNPDGLPGDIHYEIDQYPEGLSLVDYRDYNLKSRNPDVIFIHNPYDELNYVTSIIPSFYSSELKKYTDMLVYIPYFVNGGQTKEIFCDVPGVINADKVFLQTEAEKETYIKKYQEMFGKSDVGNKFLCLGSPKLDRAQFCTIEDLSIPKEWQSKMSGKKVILYNTTIDCILEWEEQIFLKIRNVFKVFEKYNNLVLLWRPHPLIFATLKSMRPELLNEYEQLIKEFQRYDRWILDNSADLHKAIAISDAYYGDGGSLWFMYHLTNKPMMLQNYKKPGDEKSLIKWSAIFECFVECDTEYWASAYYFNGLFCIDKATMRPRFVGCFPNEKINKERLFGSAVICGDIIYFSPMSADGIATFSLTTNEIASIELPEIFYKRIKNEGHLKYKFYRSAAYRDKIYFFGSLYPGILCYDTAIKKFEIITLLDDYINKDCEPYFSQIIQNGKDIIIALHRSNFLLSWDLEIGNVYLNDIHNLYGGINTVDYDGQDYWIMPKTTGTIVRWNPRNKSEKVYWEVPKGCEAGENRFAKTILYNEEIYIFPYSAKKVLKINSITNEMRIDNELTNCLGCADNNGGKVKLVFTRNNSLYIFTENFPSLIEYNSIYGIKEISLSINHAERNRVLTIEGEDEFRRHFLKYPNTVFKEDKNYRLNGFLKFLDDSLIPSRSIIPKKDDCFNSIVPAGTKIYQEVKKSILGD